MTPAPVLDTPAVQTIDETSSRPKDGSEEVRGAEENAAQAPTRNIEAGLALPARGWQKSPWLRSPIASRRWAETMRSAPSTDTVTALGWTRVAPRRTAMGVPVEPQHPQPVPEHITR